LLATIHYQDERLETYRQSPAALLLAVNLVNRDNLPEMLEEMITHRQVFDKLDHPQKKLCSGLAAAVCSP